MRKNEKKENKKEKIPGERKLASIFFIFEWETKNRIRMVTFITILKLAN